MGANDIDRRRALIVIGAVTPCIFSCVAPPVDTPIDGVDNPRDPDDGDGGTPSNPDDPTPSGGDEAETEPVAPADTGTSPPSDAGTTPATDSGSPGGGGTTDAGGGGGATGGGGTPVTCPSITSAGSVTSLPKNTWKRVSGTAVFILGHDAGGIYAFSAKCTHHTSVTIGAPNSSGVATCPSHGAQFDSNGNVIRGPATSPLKHYAVTICGGNIYVDTSKTVAASTRA
jgi:nitrite reductase/ring-hydroxylating ferredoxin subunit